MAGKQLTSIYPIRYRNGQLEYLMIKRATLSYNWQCVTGSVGQSMGSMDHPEKETPLECGVRELFEETGYKAAHIIEFDAPEDMLIEDEPQGRLIPANLQALNNETTFFTFIARIDEQQDPVLIPTEHTDWKWCDFKTAYDLIMWAVEKKAIRLVNEYLVKNSLNQ